MWGPVAEPLLAESRPVMGVKSGEGVKGPVVKGRAQ